MNVSTRPKGVKKEPNKNGNFSSFMRKVTITPLTFVASETLISNLTRQKITLLHASQTFAYDS